MNTVLTRCVLRLKKSRTRCETLNSVKRKNLQCRHPQILLTNDRSRRNPRNGHVSRRKQDLLPIVISSVSTSQCIPVGMDQHPSRRFLLPPSEPLSSPPSSLNVAGGHDFIHQRGVTEHTHCFEISLGGVSPAPLPRDPTLKHFQQNFSPPQILSPTQSCTVFGDMRP